MCGIVGIKQFAGNVNDALASVRAMGLSLRHRGPDAWGEFYDSDIVLGHRRLAILDVGGGSQPMVSSSGRTVVAFNGEIYNYRELWRELESKGCRFRTDHSDTEVIVNGYEIWGSALFARLNGMFAIAIWDRMNRRLLLARDRIGIKPLYYCTKGDGAVLFASEPKALVVSGEVNLTFDEERLPEFFLFRSCVHPRTMWREMKKVPPATVLVFTDEARAEQYWAPAAPASDCSASVEEEELAAELAEAVRSQMISDVPVGVFLSGGVDSSIIAANLGSSNVEGFAIGTDSQYNEIPAATSVASRLGINLNSYVVTPDDFLGRFEDWVYVNDDPVADPSALGLMVLTQFAQSKGMKVMLSGEGGDELFGGYNAYLRFLFAQWASRAPLGNIVVKALIPFVGPKTREYLSALSNVRFWGTAHMTTGPLRRRVLDEKLDLPEETLVSSATSLRLALMFDQQLRLPNDVLARTDRATMAASIEARVPLLDNRIIDLSARLPSRQLIQPVTMCRKIALKRYLAKRLGRRLVYRRKRGFELPVAAWLRSHFKPMIEDLLAETQVPGVNYLGMTSVFGEHLNGRDHSEVLWAWVTLERWFRMWHAPSSRAQPARDAEEWSRTRSVGMGPWRNDEESCGRI